MTPGFALLPPMLVAALVSASPQAAHQSCSIKQDDLASQRLAKAASLMSLYKASKLFPGCLEGGGTAEEASDDVVVRLSHHWSNSIGELEKHQANPGLIAFVLRHIDATTDSDDLKVISAKAKTACPLRAKALCRKVKTEADAALSEQRRFGVVSSLGSSAGVGQESAA